MTGIATKDYKMQFKEKDAADTFMAFSDLYQDNLKEELKRDYKKSSFLEIYEINGVKLMLGYNVFRVPGVILRIQSEMQEEIEGLEKNFKLSGFKLEKLI